MSLSSLPTELLLLCLERSDGRVRRVCKVLCAAFDELARAKGVDLVLSGWRNIDPCAEKMTDVFARATLRVRPVAEGYDIEVVKIQSRALDEAAVQHAVSGGRSRFVGVSNAFGMFNHKSTKCALGSDSAQWYPGGPALCLVERNGRCVRIIVQACNSDRRPGRRYFTVADQVDLCSSRSLAPFLELGPRILAAVRFCKQLLK